MALKDIKDRTKEAVKRISQEKGYVSAVDILIDMGYLSQADYKRWREGNTRYLEAVCRGNLNKLNAILDETIKVSHDLGMKPSRTVYKGWGKEKNRVLQFSKSGNPYLEDKYSTHYVLKKNKTNKITPEGNMSSDKNDFIKPENKASDPKKTDERKTEKKTDPGKRRKTRRENRKPRKNYTHEEDYFEEYGWFYGEYYGSKEEKTESSLYQYEGDIPF